MVKIMANPYFLMDDLGEGNTPLFSETNQRRPWRRCGQTVEVGQLSQPPCLFWRSLDGGSEMVIFWVMKNVPFQNDLKDELRLS